MAATSRAGQFSAIINHKGFVTRLDREEITRTRASFVIGGAHAHRSIRILARIFCYGGTRSRKPRSFINALVVGSELGRGGGHPGTRGAHALRSQMYGVRARGRPRRKGVRVSCRGRRRRRRSLSRPAIAQSILSRPPSVPLFRTHRVVR